MTDRAPDGEYDEWLDAVADGAGFYLACPEGHASLPPRRTCAHCDSGNLTREDLPDAGEIQTWTRVHVATPQFADDAPYVTAIANFGRASLTGVLRGVEPADVDTGTVVGVDVEERETTGDRLVVFRPR